MRTILIINMLCLCLLFDTKGQKNNNDKKRHLFSFSIETEFPVQHLTRLMYSVRISKAPTGVSLFIHGGLPAYLNQSIDYIVDKKEKANNYLKKNMKPMPGIGAGTNFFYRRWTIDFLYQNTGYKLNQKNARELVENLLPDDASYIATDMANFSRMFPMFGNVYNNYKLTSKARLHQLSCQLSYKFKLWKNSRFGGQFKLGAVTVFESSLNTYTDQTNEAADYLIGLINSYLDEDLREGTQWLIVPTASFGLFIKL